MLSTFKNIYYIIEKLGLLVHLKLANSEVLIKLLFESRQQKSNKLMVSHLAMVMKEVACLVRPHR